MIRKAVITAAGLGTRLLPMSKELPKEMLPIYVRGQNGIVLKPLLQAVFEQLYCFGIREFCFVVGRGKRAIEDHFTPDWSFIKRMNEKGKERIASELSNFYRMVEKSSIMWVNQPEPMGFGHAVLMARPFVKNERFLVCAGDTYIISNDFLKRMAEKNSDAVLLLQRVEDPRQYGVALVEESRVLKVVEKPEKPISNLAIMPFYVFNQEIMDILETLEPGVGGEIQLTDGIQKLIERGRKVEFVLLRDDEIRLDIGTPETYWDAIKSSYEVARG